MSTGFLLCLVAAIGFGAWPLIARWSGASPAWTISVVMLVTTSVVMIMQVWSKQITPLPGGKTYGLLVFAEVTNGLGMLAYGRLVAGTGIEISGLAPAALTMMIVIMAVGGIVFFGEAITWQKVVGVACGAVAAWLLTR